MPDVSAKRNFSASRELRRTFIRALRRFRTLQDGLLRLLGSDNTRRPALVAGMLERNPNEATSYWLQLVVSVGIATLGLVVGSAAVIIGAMLVAPLMMPIVALAMGLASGSPFLVLRSAARIALSVVLAVGGAAAITLLLPFQELNGEIAARTAPTVLDLLTAGFCALAGVYASLRPGSDTATTAAGTSIGISLVPPLCASGYGLGTASWEVAGGAALLFLTNLVAIIFVGTVSFVAAGFNRVDAPILEREELEKNQKAIVTAAIARRLSGLFESKAGPALRFFMPLLLLGAVYVPLRRGLDEVAWEVRARAAVRDTLAREPRKIVESRVRVERHEVELLVVLVGKNADAAAARQRLERDIQRGAGVMPRVEVLAIPDATAIAGLESNLRSKDDPIPIAIPPRLAPIEQLDAGASLVRSSVLKLWPAATAGEPLVIDVGVSDDGPLRLRVVHLGAALGAPALEGLSRSLTLILEREVVLETSAIPSELLTRADGDTRFTSRVAEAVRVTRAIPEINVCVVQPPPIAKRQRIDPREQELASTMRELLAQHPRVTAELLDEWSVRFVRGPCPASKPEGTPAPASSRSSSQ